MESSTQFALLVAAMTLISVGCGSSKDVNNEPSYVDLVVTYNAELESLDRLEKKRSELIADYEQQFRPDADDALELLSSVFSSASEANRDNAPAEAFDPNAALDRAVENAEKVEQVTSQLLEAMSGHGKNTAQRVPYTEEFKRQLAALDEEIEQQKARVDRARQARDAAETE